MSKAQLKQINNLIERMEYQYLTTNGMDFPNSLEGDLLKACYKTLTQLKKSF